jgi:uncharacterized protein YodC (DUF2158 family)
MLNQRLLMHQFSLLQINHKTTIMENQKFKEGDWVKKKNGTQGMTVTGYENGEVRCKYKDGEGHEIEESFQEEDLIAL